MSSILLGGTGKADWMLRSIVLVTLPVGARAGTRTGEVPLAEDLGFRIKPAISISAVPFSLGDARLLEGPFLHAVRKNAEDLMRLEPDRLLHNYRKFAGLEPRGERSTAGGNRIRSPGTDWATT